MSRISGLQVSDLLSDNRNGQQLNQKWLSLYLFFIYGMFSDVRQLIHVEQMQLHTPLPLTHRSFAQVSPACQRIDYITNNVSQRLPSPSQAIPEPPALRSVGESPALSTVGVRIFRAHPAFLNQIENLSLSYEQVSRFSYESQQSGRFVELNRVVDQAVAIEHLGLFCRMDIQIMI